MGDLLPLAMAWASGLPYGFIGTPKSDYTWRSGPGSAWPADGYHRCKGSEWDPWEWALMQGSHCRLVICRDRLTARGLRRHGVRALAPGNPMMDGFLPSPIPASLTGLRRLLLLPGSRAPEARRNLRRLLKALPPSSEHVLLLACGQQPDDASLRALMEPLGYQETAIPAGDADAAWNGLVACCCSAAAALKPAPGLSWAWPAPAPPPNSWWGWAVLPSRFPVKVRSSSAALPNAKAACWAGP